MPEEKTKKNSKLDVVTYLQFNNNEIPVAEIEAAILDAYDQAKDGEDPAEKIRIYLKPEDGKAYYVINSDYAGEVNLFDE